MTGQERERVVEPPTTGPGSPVTASVRPPAVLGAYGGPPAPSEPTSGPEAPVQRAAPVSDPPDGPQASQADTDAESPAGDANGRETAAQTPARGTDAGPRRLTPAELLPLAVAFERRQRAAHASRFGPPLPESLVPAFPDCPDCGAAPEQVDADEAPRDLDEVRIAFRPCGHRFAVDSVDACEVQQAAAWIVEGEESRSAEPAPAASGWCPHCGRGDCGPTGEQYAQAKREAAELQRRLDLAHQARRAKERRLDGIRDALLDVGAMAESDPYSHADLADVIRQVYGGESARCAHLVGPGEPGHVDTDGVGR